MAKRRVPKPVECPTCSKTISRRADLARHMKIHAPNKEELKFHCPYDGCTYSNFQQSNLKTHMYKHTGLRPHECPEADCDFITSDPGSLTRHRVQIHGYMPKENSVVPPPRTRKVTRQKRRFSPYTVSSSVSSLAPTSMSGSVSPLPSPRPQLPEILDGCSPTPLPLANNQGSKNASAAYSTELITKLPKVNDKGVPPAPEPENSLAPISGLLFASEEHALENLQPPTLEELYALELPAQPVPQTVTEEFDDAIFDQFLSQFDEWHAEAAPVAAPAFLTVPEVQHTVHDAFLSAPASLPLPMVQHAFHDALVPTPASFPMPITQHPIRDGLLPATASLPTPVVQDTVDDGLLPASVPLPMAGAQHTVHNALLPTSTSLFSYEIDYSAINPPASTFFPPYEAPYTVSDPSYDPYGYPTETVSFGAESSQPRSFAAPDVGFYPQFVDQTYAYTAPAVTNGFPMPGFYPN